tara:strand:+ start:93 stop:416 length:324 start_codon:yes stop_codon:yes gene_type:complete
MEEKVINGLSDISTDTNRDSESGATLAGTLAADCENLGQTLRMLADEIEKLHKYQDNLARKIPSTDDTDELWDKLLPKVEELVKETIREAEVDIDAHLEINSASLRV